MNRRKAAVVIRSLKSLIRPLIIGTSTFLLLILSPDRAVYADCNHPWCCAFHGWHACSFQGQPFCSYAPHRGRSCSDGLVYYELGQWQAAVFVDPNGAACKALNCQPPFVCMWFQTWSQHCDGCWCSPGCFPAGTEIKTGAGQSKEIQDLTVGDSVISFNTETGEEEPTTVEDIQQVEREGYYRIKIRDLETGEIRELEATGEHPLYAIQQEDQEPQSESLFSRLVGLIKKLIATIIDLVR